MDRTAFPPRLIALIPRPVGMRGSDGKRFDARVPLGRHFPLSSRYKLKSFFHPMAPTGRHGVDGRRLSDCCLLHR